MIERGDAYFLVQPRVDNPDVRRLQDVQRTFLLLKRADGQYRRIMLGHKRLPRSGAGRRERFWSFIDRIGPLQSVLEDLRPFTYLTQTRGERFQPGARLVAAGRYAIARHGEHTHFSYELDAAASERACEMIAVPFRARFLLLAMQPRLGQRGSREWHQLPPELQALFGEKRFADAVPALLNREGTNLVLVPVRRSPYIDLGPPPKLLNEIPAAWVTRVPSNPDLQLALELRLPDAS